MVANSRRIEFHQFDDMAAHLDRWAQDALATPDDWHGVLVATREWLDYSARNEVLLASYGVDGPVAGVETWRLVPSTAGRACAVRGGEQGYPIRVPVTTQGSEPDPYLGGNRPTRAAVERWEWRPVFAIDQLARRPAPDALVPLEVPSELTGPDGDAAFLAAARRVATSTVRGRLPKLADSHRVLADAAGRLPRSAKRGELEPVLREQAAWLVADRVGRAAGSLPGFDPGPLAARERWQQMQDVLDPARRLTAALGVAVGVDLTASPLPRMTVVDDRVVPAGRRHRLPAASLEQLPVGRWVEVGPYTHTEWAARGETGAGRGVYLRLNKSAYLVALEHGDSAGWRLEDVAARTGNGLLATGTARSLENAKATALATVQDRYPALAHPTPDFGAPTPASATTGWESMPGRGRSSAEMRRVGDQVTVYVIPGPGGRWMPAVQTHGDSTLERLPLTRTRDEARDAAEFAGRRALREVAVSTPARFDDVVAELAGSDDYHRGELVDLVGRRLDQDDRTRLEGEPRPAELVELLGSAGVTPATTMLVLRAEGVDARDAAAVLPIAGVAMPDGIRVLHERWHLARPDAAEALGATAIEMRAAGCTAAEIMLTRPREVLRALDADPHLWEVAAGTMAGAGHPSGKVVGHLLAHAPTPDAFAAGLATVVPDPAEGVALAVHYGAQGEHLVAASERYELSPAQTATALADAGSTAQVGVETLLGRCDHDPVLTMQLAHAGLNLQPATALDCLERAAGPLDPTVIEQIHSMPAWSQDAAALDPVSDTTSSLAIASRSTASQPTVSRSMDLDDADVLLAALPEPGPATDSEFADLLGALPAPLEREPANLTELQR